ncbi:MAG: hypothetical protein GEU79_13435 [Acidimicrobiia bacterium]|nr:hypothetical protein [Acidimicrobiia bacterium]
MSRRSLGGHLDALDEAGWTRSGIYNYPARSERSVEWIVTHTIHEVIHHHADIVASVVDGFRSGRASSILSRQGLPDRQVREVWAHNSLGGRDPFSSRR